MAKKPHKTPIDPLRKAQIDIRNAIREAPPCENHPDGLHSIKTTNPDDHSIEASCRRCDFSVTRRIKKRAA